MCKAQLEAPDKGKYLRTERRVKKMCIRNRDKNLIAQEISKISCSLALILLLTYLHTYIYTSTYVTVRDKVATNFLCFQLKRAAPL